MVPAWLLIAGGVLFALARSRHSTATRGTSSAPPPAGRKPKPSPPPAAAPKQLPAQASATAPAAKPAAKAKPKARPWTHETREDLLVLKRGRQYCAVLDGVTELADADDVADELSQLHTWQSLVVWELLDDVPMELPLSSEERDGRFWVLGEPSSDVSFARDPRITDVWSRPALG